MRQVRYRRNFYRQAWFAAALVALALPAMSGAAFAVDKVSTSTDPGFVPDTGQINPGFDRKLPGASESRMVPTPAQAYAALMAPVSTQPSLGEPTGAASPAAATTGSAAPTAAPAAPIGAIGATLPAKFSARNATLDRVPIMALPLPLSEAQRHSIYQAAMADKAPAASDADKLAPASVLSIAQNFNDMHPLPARVRGMVMLKSLNYVKTKDKVFLVEPSTRVVFDEIDS